MNQLTDPNNCGACGKICPGSYNGPGVCVTGTCKIACHDHFDCVGTGFGGECINIAYPGGPDICGCDPGYQFGGAITECQPVGSAGNEYA